MNNPSYAVILLLCILLFACVAPSAALPVPFRNLAKGSYSGIDEAKEELIIDQAAWEKLWSKHSARSKPGEEIPKLDFSKEMVIAVTMGRQRTGGYAVEVVNIEKSGDRLKISIKRTSPPADGITTQALSAPFHFVATAKSNLKADFVNSR